MNSFKKQHTKALNLFKVTVICKNKIYSRKDTHEYIRKLCAHSLNTVYHDHQNFDHITLYFIPSA